PGPSGPEPCCLCHAPEQKPTAPWRLPSDGQSAQLPSLMRSREQRRVPRGLNACVVLPDNEPTPALIDRRERRYIAGCPLRDGASVLPVPASRPCDRLDSAPSPPRDKRVPPRVHRERGWPAVAALDRDRKSTRLN